MSDYRERLLTAQWVFERNLGWIAAAEIKVGFLVAIDTAMLAGLGAAFSLSGTVHSAWSNLFVYSSAFMIVCGLYCASKAVLPRLNGPEKSLVFFGRIASLEKTEYADNLKNATDAELLDDWSAQIHRNAEIACIKHGWVRSSMLWLFASVLPWLAAIVLLLKK